MTEKSPVKVIELIEVNGKHVSKEGGKRQYHHKSKNGCDNCKRRRVKCTEEKPSCSKCIKMNHECIYSKPLPRRRRTKKEIELSKKLEAGLIKEEDVEKELLDNQRSNSGHKSASRTSALLKVEEAVEADLINSNNFSDSSNVNRSHTSGSKFDSVGNSKNNSNSSTGSNRNAKVKYIVKREDGSIVTLNNDPTELKGVGDGNKNKSSGILNANAKNTSFFSGNNGNHHSLPQLMSLTSSEKYATAVSATGNDNILHPNIKNNSQTNLNLNFQMNGGQNNSKNSINGLSSPQSNTMSMTNSIGTFFSLNNAKLLSNLTKNTKVETNNTSQNPSGLELQNQKSDLTFQSPNRSKDDKQLLNSPFPNMSSNVSSLIAGLNPKSAKMALANLPKLASAFGGGNKDDMAQSAMSFISMLSQGNKVTKPDSNGKSNGLPKDLQSKIDAIMKDLPKDAVNNLDTPNTLAGLASIGISIGNNPSELTGLIDSLQDKGKPVVKQNKPFSAGDAKLVNSQDEGSTRSNSGGNKATKGESSKSEENKNMKHEYSNFFNNFYNNNKMSMPSTPNIFQPAGIGGITYDFNELMNNQLTNGESVDVNQHKTALLTDNENMDPQSQTHMDKLKSPNSVMNQGSLLFNTPEILKSPILTPSQHMNDSTTSKDAFSRAHKDLKDEAVEVLSTMATVAQRDKLTANDNKNSPGNLFLVKPQDSTGSHHMSSTASQNKLADDNGCIDIEGILEIQGSQLIPGLNLIDLRLFQHYLKTVSKTIIESGICAASSSIWTEDIPDLAFEFPFLMHSILAFSATHLSRTESGLDEVVATHRLDCLKLLKDAVLEITPENTDALIASAIILIMDSLANAMPAQNNEFDEEGSASLSTSAWIFHVKGAATILTAVWPIPEKSRFYNLINVDLTELSQYFINGGGSDLKTGEKNVTDLACFDESIQDLYPVEIDSPYLITLAYLEKLNKGIDKDGFLLRIFSFPALLDKTFLFMLMTGDMNAMRIMRTYYKMLRSYVIEKKGNIWFLEGLTHVLPANVDEYTGGGVYMMLDFLGNGLPSMMGNVFGNDGGSGLLSALNFDTAFDPSDGNNNNDMDR